MYQTIHFNSLQFDSPRLSDLKWEIDIGSFKNKQENYDILEKIAWSYKTLDCHLIRFQSVRGSQDQYLSDRPTWKIIWMFQKCAGFSTGSL